MESQEKGSFSSKFESRKSVNGWTHRWLSVMTQGCPTGLGRGSREAPR